MRGPLQAGPQSKPQQGMEGGMRYADCSLQLLPTLLEFQGRCGVARLPNHGLLAHSSAKGQHLLHSLNCMPVLPETTRWCHFHARKGFLKAKESPL